MAEYTPDPKPTARIRDLFVFATAWDMSSDKPFYIHRMHENAGREWDRWLAAHDRAVKAEALREAAEDWGDTTWNDVWMADGVEDDVSAVQSTVKWLRARADQIEGNTE